jgi:hypothetical protein
VEGSQDPIFPCGIIWLFKIEEDTDKTRTYFEYGVPGSQVVRSGDMVSKSTMSAEKVFILQDPNE